MVSGMNTLGEKVIRLPWAVDRTCPARSWRAARGRSSHRAAARRDVAGAVLSAATDDGADGWAGVEPGSAGIGDTLSEESERATRTGRDRWPVPDVTRARAYHGTSVSPTAS